MRTLKIIEQELGRELVAAYGKIAVIGAHAAQDHVARIAELAAEAKYARLREHGPGIVRHAG